MNDPPAFLLLLDMTNRNITQQIPRDKYDCAGVYSISAYDHILYIGKSINMRRRIIDHIRYIQDPSKVDPTSGPHKYEILNEIYNSGLPISFGVLYRGEDIDRVEAELIDAYRPILNLRRPTPRNPRDYYKNNELARTITLDEILSGMWTFVEDE